MGVKEIAIGGEIKLLVHEQEDVYDSGTGRALTGAWLWDSARVLAQWMSVQALDFTNKIVLELGAGTGLPGLTAARLGAARVILTDIEPLIQVLEKNVEVNGLSCQVEVCQLEWSSEELPMKLRELDRPVDVVLLSDVFFDAQEVAALANTLKKVCGRETVVWAASEIRPWTSDALYELTSEGFKIVELWTQQGGVGLPSTAEDGSPAHSGAATSFGDSELFTVFQLVPPHQDLEHLP